jgi:hypothetical protein
LPRATYDIRYRLKGAAGWLYAYFLDTNAPAPQGKATFAFTLPAGGRLSLALVDPLGRKRTLLPVAYYPPGKNELPIPLPQKGLWLLLVEAENQPPKTLKIWAE